MIKNVKILKEIQFSKHKKGRRTMLFLGESIAKTKISEAE